ncbi:MAG TPA: cytidylate kinase family protein, partial [Trebonia sp.]|nr:cytidylate kinase family protein [Trebonia sp.]
MRGVVTLSASYGARGDAVGRALAERLQLPFVDRVIPTSAAAHELGLPEEIAESLDEPTPNRWERIASRFVWATAPSVPEMLTEDVPDTPSPEEFRAASEAELQQVADTT